MPLRRLRPGWVSAPPEGPPAAIVQHPAGLLAKVAPQPESEYPENALPSHSGLLRSLLATTQGEPAGTRPPQTKVPIRSIGPIVVGNLEPHASQGQPQRFHSNSPAANQPERRSRAPRAMLPSAAAGSATNLGLPQTNAPNPIGIEDSSSPELESRGRTKPQALASAPAAPTQPRRRLEPLPSLSPLPLAASKASSRLPRAVTGTQRVSSRPAPGVLSRPPVATPEAVMQAAPPIASHNTSGPEERRVGGSRSWRNHNPGNIVYGPFARAHGATGHDSGGFAVFPTTAAGRRAQNALWRTRAYQGRTVRGAADRWTHGDPPATQRAYGEALARAAAAPTTTPISSLTPSQMRAMESAQQRQERWTPGQVVDLPARRRDEQ